ncbi:glycosyltransferase family 2 protein [Haloarcula sp. CBA1130]|uniref:glycosyltransferase family 2 protein n=1 Tax=unclassified Haloarcula TaxID=2624677 RepID=UPI00124514D5|nr:MULTISPECIES: glycosyltransferase family A protein [unclassified Haloarcula]KAA9395874.1 glycosyltransferase family 2 protein [Haloarcula sp. CBA1129]KAA9400196.1 glycosyltransferase family 2 protein [Haloarcula sp. CBA1130]
MPEAGNTDDGTPLVSVIIPTYGRDEDLPSAIQSVFDQQYERVELLVVDDGSPTPVATTLPERLLSDERMTVIRHERNKGANVARNTGIRTANGDYIAFLDDDDRWDETKLRKQVDTFSRSPAETGVVYTWVKREHPSGTTVSTPTAAGDAVTDLLTGSNFGQFSSVLVDTDVIAEAGLPDERFPAWQDREWFFRLAQSCEFQPVEESLTYRQTGQDDSITSKFQQKRDVAYPLFVEKHGSLAAEYGRYYKRTFLASMRRSLARSAIRAGQYGEARKYFLLAFFANPLHRPVYPHLLPSLGGKWTYESIASLRRRFAETAPL